MNVTEFRNQKITNTRLAWLVHGQSFDGSFEEFTKEELELIRQVEDDEETLETINKILSDDSLL